MGRFDKKEPKLNEVKAVLQRLQGFPEDERPVQATPARVVAPQKSLGIFVVGAISVVLIGGVFGTVYMFTGSTPSEPPQKAAVETAQPKKAPVESIAVPQPLKSEAVKTALETARAMMAKGQVRAARDQLLALATKGSPDAAWDVARSYDPNVLATIAEADAAADIPEATRWYRAWYEAAVKEGMVANSVSLERIISAMDKSGRP